MTADQLTARLLEDGFDDFDSKALLLGPDGSSGGPLMATYDSNRKLRMKDRRLDTPQIDIGPALDMTSPVMVEALAARAALSDRPGFFFLRFSSPSEAQRAVGYVESVKARGGNIAETWQIFDARTLKKPLLDAGVSSHLVDVLIRRAVRSNTEIGFKVTREAVETYLRVRGLWTQ